jgi:hypothetical protein
MPVECKTCHKQYTKPAEDIVRWDGNCARCALDIRRGRPKAREAKA